jgi:Domain of unknown function (DUF4160)
MPTLKRFASMSVTMYADDHRPPHFHIVSANFEVLVALSDFTVLAGRARRSAIIEALDWAQANRDLLNRRWAELNERG